MKSTDNPSPSPSSAVHDPMVSEVYEFSTPVDNALSEVESTTDIFCDDELHDVQPRRVPGCDMLYIPFGRDDRAPYRLVRTAGTDVVLSQNLFFNILTLYGGGLRYIDRTTGEPTDDPEIDDFIQSNSLSEFFLEQCTDIKHYFFTVAVIILDRDGKKIVQLRHKDACHCRFEKADGKGRINHVFVANWHGQGLSKKDVETVVLLDERNPLGHLEVLMGRRPGADGLTEMRTRRRKFAVVMRFPTPGNRYYPSPYYMAIFRSDWFDIERLIGAGKKSKIRNSGSVRYHVEIHKDYWPQLMQSEGIFDPAAIAARKKKELTNIRNFVTGSRNAGKVWISSYYIDSYGKEQRMVRINVIDTSKEGGDWSEDIQETSNMLCYGLNIHPNLVGATPGKSQTNNSGSDKRELFTLKQALETSFRDVLLKVHSLVIRFNGWKPRVYPAVPIVQLTTLDKHSDAEERTPSPAD